MPLEVIGAGFGRTGTLSLKLALERLGFGPCHHMHEVFLRGAVDDWNAVFDGETRDWERIFADFRSTVDWPSTAVWRELAEAYPKAKVILTVRDPDAWFDSTQATIFARDYSKTPTNAFEAMAQKMVRRHFDLRMRDRAYMTAKFAEHIDVVRSALPAERLLVYDVAEGWNPLCGFLEVPVPKEPMPRVNAREDFWAETAKLVAKASSR